MYSSCRKTIITCRSLLKLTNVVSAYSTVILLVGQPMLIEDLQRESAELIKKRHESFSVAYLFIMPQDDLCLSTPGEHLNHLIASHPVVMVSS